MVTCDSGAQLAKKREYSLGRVTGKDLFAEESGGGESSRKLKRKVMKWDSTTHMLGFDWSSNRTWIRDSSERRKNPRRSD